MNMHPRDIRHSFAVVQHAPYMRASLLGCGETETKTKTKTWSQEYKRLFRDSPNNMSGVASDRHILSVARGLQRH